MVLTQLGGGGYDYVQDTQPSNPDVGETWYDESKSNVTNRSKIYADVGNGNEWVVIPSPDLSWGLSYNIGESKFAKSLDVSSKNSSARGVAWSNDGSKLYTIDASNGSVFSYTVTTSYDLSTATFNQSLNVSGQDGFPESLAWNDDGSKLYIAGNNNDSIFSYTVSTTYDISTATFNQSLDVSGQDGSPTGVEWNDDGSKLYITGDDNDKVYSYTVNTSYDISTATSNQALDVSGQDTNITGLAWGDAGSKLYVSGGSNGNIYGYTVTTAYDISTATFNQSLDVSAQDDPSDLTWNDDGSKLYMIAPNTIYDYVVGTVVKA